MKIRCPHCLSEYDELFTLPFEENGYRWLECYLCLGFLGTWEVATADDNHTKHIRND